MSGTMSRMRWAISLCKPGVQGAFGPLSFSENVRVDSPGRVVEIVADVCPCGDVHAWLNEDCERSALLEVILRHLPQLGTPHRVSLGVDLVAQGLHKRFRVGIGPAGPFA